MKLTLYSSLLLFIFSISFSFAQEINQFNFSELPENKQLYGRNPDNHSNVTFAGFTRKAGYNYISVVKYRNKKRTGYTKQSLNYNSAKVANFNLSTKIKAELAAYDFDLYACKSKTDSTLIVSRKDVVSGDFYVIYGQSNAVAWEFDYTYRNEFCRTYGSTGIWALSNSQTPRVGIFGIELQRQIAERHQIPTCVINGALSGAAISHLTYRNPNNHADPSTAYGSLLNYVKKSKLLPYIKGMFYWQGETEASSDNPASWAPQFDTLIKLWKEDYPNTEKIYVFQLPLFGGGAYDDRIGAMREEQRLLDQKHPIVQPYGPLGAPGWDGFHYGLEGYLKVGKELADMVDYNHYGRKEKITSPSLQKAYFSTPAHDEITLAFEDYQTMVYPNDTLVQNIEGSLEPWSTHAVKDFFFLNGKWQKLKSGRAEANRIILTLKEPLGDTIIKYLPSKYHFSGLTTAAWVYIGPFLKNTKGFRAMAFHHNKIHPYQNLGNLEITAEETEQITVRWNKLDLVKKYMLLRTNETNPTEEPQIIHLENTEQSYIDVTAKQGHTYTYQIRGYTDNNETNIAQITYTKVNEDIKEYLPDDETDDNVEEEEEEIIEEEEEIIENPLEETPITFLLKVFPNPGSDIIHIESDVDKISKIEIFSHSGRWMGTRNFAPSQQVSIDVNHLQTGPYLLKIHTGTTPAVSKKVFINR
jgi:hypothetical protein